MVIEDPFLEATGRHLRDAVLEWDARGIKLSVMADRIKAASGHSIGRSTLARLLATYRSTSEQPQ